MTFFKRMDIGRLYVIRIELPDGVVVHKIGMTHSDRATDRMMEILRSWFTRYRFVPYSELKLDMECHHPMVLEGHLHAILADFAFIPNEKVSGGTEMFTGVNEPRLLHYIRNFNENLVDNFSVLTEQESRVVGQLLAG